MKFILTKLMIILGWLSISANPIMVVTLFTEIYFEGDEWQIEIPCEVLNAFGTNDLDNVRIVTSQGFSQFNPGISCGAYDVLVISNNDLINQIIINKTGDFINFQTFHSGQWWDMTPFYFGDYAGSEVNPLFEGQSYVLALLYHEEIYNDWWLVKESSPSIGISWAPVSRGTFHGYVFDINYNPVQDIQIEYCDEAYFTMGSTILPIYTDSNGFFENTEMFAKNYGLSIEIDNINLYDSIITVEPNDSTYLEIVLEFEVTPDVCFSIHNNKCLMEFDCLHYSMKHGIDYLWFRDHELAVFAKVYRMNRR